MSKSKSPTPLNFENSAFYSEWFGEWHATLEARWCFMTRQEGGWLKRPTFEPVTYGNVIMVNPLTCNVYVSMLGENCPPVPTFDTDFDQVNDPEESGDRKKIDAYFKKLETLNWKFVGDINDFGTWETVNQHQWESRQPAQLRNGHGIVVATELPMWSVATTFKGERIAALIGHNSRDEVFAYNVRLNQFFDHWRKIIETFRNDINEYNPDGKPSVASIDDDEARTKMWTVFADISEYDDENPSPWR